MKIRTILAVCALAIGQAAVADAIHAIELSPSHIILPASVNGTMTYRACSGECDAEYDRARLTEETRFTVDGQRVKFDDFRVQLARIKNAKGSFAGIRINARTNTITNIDIRG